MCYDACTPSKDATEKYFINAGLGGCFGVPTLEKLERSTDVYGGSARKYIECLWVHRVLELLAEVIYTVTKSELKGSQWRFRTDRVGNSHVPWLSTCGPVTEDTF